jgi:hypothetical protein
MQQNLIKIFPSFQPPLILIFTFLEERHQEKRKFVSGGVAVSQPYSILQQPFLH